MIQFLLCVCERESEIILAQEFIFTIPWGHGSLNIEKISHCLGVGDRTNIEYCYK